MPPTLAPQLSACHRAGIVACIDDTDAPNPAVSKRRFAVRKLSLEAVAFVYVLSGAALCSVHVVMRSCGGADAAVAALALLSGVAVQALWLSACIAFKGRFARGNAGGADAAPLCRSPFLPALTADALPRVSRCACSRNAGGVRLATALAVCAARARGHMRCTHARAPEGQRARLSCMPGRQTLIAVSIVDA